FQSEKAGIVFRNYNYERAPRVIQADEVSPARRQTDDAEAPRRVGKEGQRLEVFIVFGGDKTGNERGWIPVDQEETDGAHEPIASDHEIVSGAVRRLDPNHARADVVPGIQTIDIVLHILGVVR